LPVGQRAGVGNKERAKVETRAGLRQEEVPEYVCHGVHWACSCGHSICYSWPNMCQETHSVILSPGHTVGPTGVWKLNTRRVVCAARGSLRKLVPAEHFCGDSRVTEGLWIWLSGSMLA
jgi:hypothetical protein